MHSDSSSLLFAQTHCSAHPTTGQGADICLACTGAGRVPQALQMPPARCQDGTWQLGAARAPKPQTPARQHTASKHKALAMQKRAQKLEEKRLHSRFYGFQVHLGEPEAQPQLAAPGMGITQLCPACSGASVLGTESLLGSLNCAFDSAKVCHTKHLKLTQIKKKKTTTKPKNTKP